MSRRTTRIDSYGPAPSVVGAREVSSSRAAPDVVDNLPTDIASTARELEALEIYLADLLDELFDEVALGASNAGE